MTNTTQRIQPSRIRERGSVYVLVLGASLLVAAIGTSSLLATRVQHRTSEHITDRGRARELARSAVDMAMLKIESDRSFWRLTMSDGTLTNVAFAGGAYSVTITDPIDGDLTNNSTDPVQLVGMGKVNEACAYLQVTLDGAGNPMNGTWQWTVQ